MLNDVAKRMTIYHFRTGRFVPLWNNFNSPIDAARGLAGCAYQCVGHLDVKNN